MVQMRRLVKEDRSNPSLVVIAWVRRMEDDACLVKVRWLRLKLTMTPALHPPTPIGSLRKVKKQRDSGFSRVQPLLQSLRCTVGLLNDFCER